MFKKLTIPTRALWKTRRIYFHLFWQAVWLSLPGSPKTLRQPAGEGSRKKDQSFLFKRHYNAQLPLCTLAPAHPRAPPMKVPFPYLLRPLGIFPPFSLSLSPVFSFGYIFLLVYLFSGHTHFSNPSSLRHNSDFP